MNNTANNRILHIPRRFVAEEWGGTETVLLEISREQQRTGWRPEILTSLALSRQPRETMAGIPIRRFKYCYPYLGLSTADKAVLDRKGGSLVAPGLFVELMRAKNVRLFHLHTMARLGGEVRTAARWRKIPYVLSTHGGAFDYPGTELKTMMRPTDGKLEWGKALGAVLGSRHVLGDADHIVCVGQAEFDEARKKVPHDRVSYLPNGVDSEKFARGDGAAFRRKHGIPGDATLILNISRIDAQKNQRALLEAFARLRARRPECFLALMGPETQVDYADGLRKYIRDHGLDGVVRMLPGVRPDDPELPNAYHACDIFALPSVHEPFGIVVLEAWSAGKPVVAAQLGGLRKLIRDHETGLFFDPLAADAAEKLTNALESLIASPLLRRGLADAGRAEVQARYGWPEIGRQLEIIYEAAERHRLDRSKGRT